MLANVNIYIQYNVKIGMIVSCCLEENATFHTLRQISRKMVK